MQIEQLIDSLAEDLRPSPPGALERRMAAGIILGMVASGVLMALGLGIRADLLRAMHGFVFWMKAGYATALAAVAISAAIRLSKPDTTPPRWLWLLAVPVLAVAGLAAGEFIRTPPQGWLDLWLGSSWMVCPILLFGLSVPIFLGLLWAQAKLAPTRLKTAGTVAGVAAGATATLVYCLHCPESTAAFVLTWYSLGIGAAGFAGRLLGPRLLRW